MEKLDSSARLLSEEAGRRGYVVTRYEDRHLLKISDGKKDYFTRGSRTSKQSSVGVTIANYKNLTRKVLEGAGFPMPFGRHFITKKDGLKWAESKDLFPLVFKPSTSNHGTGVVVGIRNLRELADVITGQPPPQGYILEKELVGNDFRILVINYRFFAATRREPAYVVADGFSTIKQLIEAENNNPDRGVGHEKNLTKIKIDRLVAGYLKEQGYSLEYVPTEGLKIILRRTAGLSTGGVGIDVTDEVGVANVRMFEALSRLVDLNTVGIDVMASTLKTPIRDQKNAGIMEINASPGLRMHHFPFVGRKRNAAGAILDMLFNT